MSGQNKELKNYSEDFIKGLRRKYGITQDKSNSHLTWFKVEYKNISKLDRVELATAFECKPDQVATSLKEVHSGTECVYLTKLSDRIFLAKTTSNKLIQSQLLNNFKDFYEIAKQLVFNPNLTDKIAKELEAATHNRLLIQTKGYEDTNLTEYLKFLSFIETWSNPDVSIFTLLTFIKAGYIPVLKSKQFYLNFEKFIFDEDFIQSLADNKQITPELIDTVDSENKHNIYQTNQFLAVYPNTSGEIIENIVKKIDIQKLNENRNLIRLIIGHKNTKSETLSFVSRMCFFVQ